MDSRHYSNMLAIDITTFTPNQTKTLQTNIQIISAFYFVTKELSCYNMYDNMISISFLSVLFSWRVWEKKRSNHCRTFSEYFDARACFHISGKVGDTVYWPSDPSFHCLFLSSRPTLSSSFSFTSESSAPHLPLCMLGSNIGQEVWETCYFLVKKWAFKCSDFNLAKENCLCPDLTNIWGTKLCIQQILSILLCQIFCAQFLLSFLDQLLLPHQRFVLISTTLTCFPIPVGSGLVSLEWTAELF